MQLPVRWRYKLDRWRSQIASRFHSQPSVARPRLCPSCGTLVGSSAGRCHQCGASLTFSMAAASRSLGRIVPQTSPVSYGILGLCCILYGVSLLATINRSGFQAPTGGLGALFGLGGIDGRISYRMGASLPSFLSVQGSDLLICRNWIRTQFPVRGLASDRVDQPARTMPSTTDN